MSTRIGKIIYFVYVVDLDPNNPKDMAASVHQRLRDHARLTGDDPRYVLMR